MSEKRLSIFPTRMNQSIVDSKIKSAEKGHNLLKKKSDSLQTKFKQTQQKLLHLRSVADASLKAAYLSMSKAEYLGGNISFYLNECAKYPTGITTIIDSVSGVKLPVFQLDRPDKRLIVSHGKSGQSLMKCRELFLNTLELLVELCTVQNSFRILEEVYAATNRRVNSLEFNLIPKLKNTMEYILAELDEREREDFFRLKKIQKLKKKEL